MIRKQLSALLLGLALTAAACGPASSDSQPQGGGNSVGNAHPVFLYRLACRPADGAAQAVTVKAELTTLPIKATTPAKGRVTVSVAGERTWSQVAVEGRIVFAQGATTPSHVELAPVEKSAVGAMRLAFAPGETSTVQIRDALLSTDCRDALPR